MALTLSNEDTQILLDVEAAQLLKSGNKKIHRFNLEFTIPTDDDIEDAKAAGKTDVEIALDHLVGFPETFDDDKNQLECNDDTKKLIKTKNTWLHEPLVTAFYAVKAGKPLGEFKDLIKKNQRANQVKN